MKPYPYDTSYDNEFTSRNDGRQLDSGAPTYNELLQVIAEVERDDTTLSDPGAERRAMDAVMSAAADEESSRAYETVVGRDGDADKALDGGQHPQPTAPSGAAAPGGNEVDASFSPGGEKQAYEVDLAPGLRTNMDLSGFGPDNPIADLDVEFEPDENVEALHASFNEDGSVDSLEIRLADGEADGGQPAAGQLAGGGQPQARQAAAVQQDGGKQDAQDAPAGESQEQLSGAGFPPVDAEARRDVFSHPADEAMLARNTTGRLPLPDYTAQGLNDFIVPPDDALADGICDNPADPPVVESGGTLDAACDIGTEGTSNQTQPLHHADREAQAQQDAAPAGGQADAAPAGEYPDGGSAPFYSAPEEGDGPGTPTPEQQAGFANYDASPDDLNTGGV